MSLSGVRDITVIETPPRDRHPIQTYVGLYDDGMVQRAIAREVDRGGQVFYLHNRVETIDKAAAPAAGTVAQGAARRSLTGRWPSRSWRR